MKILWVCPLFLHPTTKGGQIRTLETLRQLHQRHEIHFAALADPDQPEGPRHAGQYSSQIFPVTHQAPPRGSVGFYMQALAGFVSAMPVAVSRFASAELREKVTQLMATENYDAVVCDFLAAAPNLPSMDGVTLFQHNVETTIWERHAANAPTWFHRLLFGRQARRMAAYEKRICREARNVISVSEADSQRMRDLFGVTQVDDVPTGVDVANFTPRSEPSPEKPEPATEHTAELVFLGSMDWEANVDGMLYFAAEIWPRITAQMPECRLNLVGRKPPASIQALGQADSRIQVTGTVPDVRPYLWGGQVSIVPLRIGGGTRIKIYEAMAAGLPVVSTAVGAEGLPLTSGEDILLADEPQQFADACLTLLRDKEQRDRIAQTGRNLVTERYSWATAAERFEQLLIAPAVQDAAL